MVQPPRTKQRRQPPKGKADNHQKEGTMNAHPGATGRSHSEEGSTIVPSSDLTESFETPRRVRAFDQLSQSDDELTTISKEEFSATTHQRAKASKRSKSVHRTTSNVALHNYENGKPSPVDDSDIPWQYADPDTPHYGTVPFEGRPPTPSFHCSSSPPANTKDAIFAFQTPSPNPFYSSGADLSPPTPGDMTLFNTYMSKLRARRANKAKLKDKAVTHDSALTEAGHLSSITQKTLLGQRNIEKATPSTSSKAHTFPTINNTNGRSAFPSSPGNTDELITSIENFDASYLSMSDESTITNVLQDHVTSRVRSVNPSPPTLDNSEIRSFGARGPPHSELSDSPSQTSFDAFEELGIQVGVAQSDLSNGRLEFTRRPGNQDVNDALPSMTSIGVGVSEAKMACQIAEKDPYYKLVEMLFDGIPKEVYEGLDDQKILRTSLSDVARWTRPRDDSIHNCDISPDPSGVEMIRVIAAVEVSLITMWAAVESMAVLLYAVLKDGFTIGMLQEHTRHWQIEIYRTYELLLPHLTTIARWKESYFAISNFKKRSARNQTNPYARLFQQTTVTGHLAYGSAVYLRNLSWAISSAKCAYDVACMKGPRRERLVGKDRSELGNEYDLCLRGLRKFNQFVMQRDWDVKEVVEIAAAPSNFPRRNATPETLSCANSVAGETGALLENHISKTDKATDIKSINGNLVAGSRANTRTSKRTRAISKAVSCDQHDNEY